MRGRIVLTGMLLMGSAFPSAGSIAYAIESSDTGNFQEGSSYYFINYNGGEQEIVLSENVKLILTGWTDESKLSVNGRIEIENDSSSQIQDITLAVNDELNEIAVSENESIPYRLAMSDSFKVDEVKPLNLNEHITVVAENENGTSIEEVQAVDEYGTVIQNKGLTYYSIDENNKKIEITEEEYNSLNSDVDPSTEVIATNDNPIVSENSFNLVKEDYSLKSVQTTATSSPVENPSVVYSTHVQDYGWLAGVSDGQMSGTEGQAKRLEAIKISLDKAPYSGGISYTTHVQDYGWLNNVSDGALSGTSGESKRLEAIQINLTGEMAQHYDIYYRVHAQDYGWLDWAKNGQSAGTQGLSRRLEAIEIVLVAKDGAAPGSTNKPLIMDPSVVYSTHVQDYGWLTGVSDGQMSGTQGQAKRLEAIKISLDKAPYSGGISYKTHVQGYGWLNNVSNGALSGTSGESKRLEAIQINLTGEMAQHFDIYYRVHAQDYGWLDWAKNGESAGTQGLSKRLEAIQIILVEKGGAAPGPTTKPFIESNITNYYSLTLNDALNMQMKVSPQTDKYRNDPAYVSSQYMNVFNGGSITGSGVNLRTSPNIADNVAVYVGKGTLFKVLDANVTGDMVSGSTRWYQIEYNGNILYVHSSLANANLRIGQATTDYLNIRAEKNSGSHIYATVMKDAQLIVLEEDNSGWYKVSIGNWRNATSSDVLYYLDPNNFINDVQQKFQFMDLKKPSGVSKETLNQYLAGKGILANQGQAFIEAGFKYGINEVYLMAHTLLETGQGTSTLAKGVEYNGRTVYNMYGVGALDSCPVECGAKTAYEKGWFTPYDAIVGGAAFIDNGYLGGNNNYNVVQNTLYEMRWNPQVMSTFNRAGHQYATDIGWAYKQVQVMYDVYKIQPYTIYLEFPVYK
ncbi:glucosaminidase domain-containing protein [Neobacillus sp. 114]|uniref:glucosaminidase domain-containing protein n=1 Tax=Neobacillus sp. 114 TaxID=3048535 RepID=UPI0024C3786B|nr:glucosaminidase domain-containing protein [Neobacillus sp. 114]